MRSVRAPGWPTVGVAAASLAVLAGIGVTFARPHALAARSCFTAAAVLLLAKLSAAIFESGRSFSREKRLAIFVALCSIALGWWSAWQWVDAREVDYRFGLQKAELKSSVTELSREILAFAAERTRNAPPAPRPETWDRDEEASLRFEADTVAAFEQRFAAQVRLAHDLFALLGITDPDFELFYKRPGNLLAIVVVGQKLAVLAAAVDHVR